MTTWLRILAVAGLAAVACGWLPARADDNAMSEDEKAIRELVKKHDAGQPIKRTDDAIFSSGPIGTVVGKAGLEKARKRSAALVKERGKMTRKTNVRAGSGGQVGRLGVRVQPVSHGLGRRRGQAGRVRRVVPAGVAEG